MGPIRASKAMMSPTRAVMFAAAYQLNALASEGPILWTDS